MHAVLIIMRARGNEVGKQRKRRASNVIGQRTAAMHVAALMPYAISAARPNLVDMARFVWQNHPQRQLEKGKTLRKKELHSKNSSSS